jgi:hypothetical protein
MVSFGERKEDFSCTTKKPEEKYAGPEGFEPYGEGAALTHPAQD